MTKSNKLFASQEPVQKGTKLNLAGAPSFDRTLEEDTLAVLLTNTLSNTFYVSDKDLAKQTVEVLTKMAKKDPEFLAKALVYARRNGLMKLAPVVGLAVLSANESGKKVNFRKVFHHVVKTPDDLREFVSLCRTKAVRQGLGGEARDAVKRWLQHMSEYHAVKYGSANSEGITLRDIIRMAHPRPVNDAQRELFGWLVKGWDDVGPKPSPTSPQVWALETLKRATSDKEVIRLVQDYKLPWEVVVPSVKKMTPEIWKALLKDMPYMALLRQLNTMERNGLFADKDVAKAVAAKLSDQTNVKYSKQLPFRFFNAYNAFKGIQVVRDAIVDALELSFENTEKLDGRVCIANDISGSMSGQVSDKGETRYRDVAGLLSAALFKKCDDVILLQFNTSANTLDASRRDSVMSLAKKIGDGDGGTNVGAPIAYLSQHRDKVDVFIGVTDSESWAGNGFLTEWEAYKKISPKAKAFVINIAPYRDFVAPAGYPDVHYISGWSDAVLKYISLTLNGGIGQVEDVKRLDLSSLDKSKVVVTEPIAE